MQPAMSNDPYSNGQRRHVSDDQFAIRGGELPARSDEILREVDTDDAPDERGKGEGESPGAAAAVESSLGPRERGEQLLNAVPEGTGALLLHGDAIPDHVTHRRPPVLPAWPASRSAGYLVRDRA